MNLRKQILAEHSKANCEYIVRWIGSHPDRFGELFNLFLHDESKVVQRAAWPLSNAVIAHPELIIPYYSRLLNNLNGAGNHAGVKRNTIRLLEDLEIPKRYHGKLMNLCFAYICDPVEKPTSDSIPILKNSNRLLNRHLPT